MASVPPLLSFLLMVVSGWALRSGQELEELGELRLVRAIAEYAGVTPITFRVFSTFP